MKFHYQKWAAAKAEFLAAAKAAVAAYEAANALTKRECGQIIHWDLDVESPVWDPAFVRDRITPDGRLPDPGKHWADSLIEVRQKTATLQALSAPEAWLERWRKVDSDR
jgi:hypothetical protein